jgi:NADPH-dependent curcumin reductase CurA
MVSAVVMRLARRPSGLPVDADFVLASAPLPEPGAGQFTVALRYISVDPAMRTWISGEKTYRDPIDPGDAIPALGIGRVTDSRHAGFPTGTIVRGGFGVASHAISDGMGVTRIEDEDEGVLPHHLGLLGVSGLSAYFGLLDIGRAKVGDTILVSGAAGAVGSAVGQIARIAGCRVVGVAGGADKCTWARDRFGFDVMLDYRQPDFAAAMADALPGGADVVFDNVGGAFLEAAIDNLALGARIVLCGGVSHYNDDIRHGPANYLSLVVKRASMTGFLVHDFAPRFAIAAQRLTNWHARGQLVGEVHLMHGLDAFPAALAGLFTGINRGKLVLALNQNGAAA